MLTKWQTIVIGGGPGGYSAAIRCAQLGLRTVLIEKQQLGGTCLNVGCIPTKYMVEMASSIHKIDHLANIGVNVAYNGLDLNKFHKSKDKVVKQLTGGVAALLKHAGVEIIKGAVEFISENFIKVEAEKGTIELEGENIIIAAGTRPSELVISFDGDYVISSSDALNLNELPQSLAIIGAGVIGMEFASIYSQLGVKVSVVEIAPNALMNEDQDTVKYVVRALQKRGVDFYLNTKVVSSGKTDQGITLVLEKDGKESSLFAEKLLIAAGRTSNADTLKLEHSGVELEKGFIKVNSNMQTSIKHIYAVGDIVGGWQLAHVAFDEGIVAAENISGNKIEMDTQYVPRSVFTSPEFSSVGMTERQAKETYTNVKAYKILLSSNGKALINGLGKAEGMAKVIVNEEYGELLGFSIAGEHVNELITDLTSVMTLESTIEDLAEIIHPHPSLSEIIKELALLASGKPLHAM